MNPYVLITQLQLSPLGQSCFLDPLGSSVICGVFPMRWQQLVFPRSRKKNRQIWESWRETFPAGRVLIAPAGIPLLVHCSAGYWAPSRKPGKTWWSEMQRLSFLERFTGWFYGDSSDWEERRSYGDNCPLWGTSQGSLRTEHGPVGKESVASLMKANEHFHFYF